MNNFINIEMSLMHIIYGLANGSAKKLDEFIKNGIPIEWDWLKQEDLHVQQIFLIDLTTPVLEEVIQRMI